MGLITSLIRENAEQKTRNREEQMKYWQTIAGLPNDQVTPEMRNWALGNLAGQAAEGLGLGGKHKDFLHQMITGLGRGLGTLNPEPGMQKPPQGAPPKHAFYTAEEGEAVRKKLADEASARKAADEQSAADIRRKGAQDEYIWQTGYAHTMEDQYQQEKLRDLHNQEWFQKLPEEEQQYYELQVRGLKPQPGVQGTLSNVQVKLPGATKPVWLKQSNKGGFYDLQGKPFAMPPGAEIVSKAPVTPQTMRELEDYWTSNFPEMDPAEAHRRATIDYHKQYEATTTSRELSGEKAAVELDPLGTGDTGVTRTAAPPPPPAPGTAKATGTGTKPGEIRPGGLNRPNQVELTMNDPAIQFALRVWTKTGPPVRSLTPKEKQIFNQGAEKFRQLTGKGPTDVQAIIDSREGLGKGLIANTENLSAFGRMSKRLDEMGILLQKARAKVSDWKPFVDRAIQDIQTNFMGNDDTQALVIAANGFQKEYGLLISNGYLSTAQTHIGSQEQANASIVRWLTSGQIDSSINQIKLEAKANSNAIIQNQRDLYDQIASPFGKSERPEPTPDTSKADAEKEFQAKVATYKKAPPGNPKIPPAVIDQLLRDFQGNTDQVTRAGKLLGYNTD